MRVLSIVSDASLEVSLSSLLPADWTIVPARDASAAAEAAATSDVALVAVGTTERGVSTVAALRDLRLAIPCLIVGDAEPSEPTTATVLVRPFAMTELTHALQAARGPAPASTLRRGTVAEPSAQAQAPAPAAPPAHAPAPAPAPAPEEWAAALLDEIGQSPAEGPARPLPAGAAPAAEASAARIVRHAAAAPAAGPWTSDAPGRGGFHRLRRRRRAPAAAVPQSGSRASMMRRVRLALEGARDLAQLVEEIPALLHPSALADAMVRETVDLLGAETAALYAATGGAFVVDAAAGLTPVEQASTVPLDHPLLGDVTARLEAVLVAPVDLVRGIVSGVGGTNVEALMVAPLEVDGVCHGVLLAGRAHFGEEDLERFWLLAEEAAPGYAAARLIERLRDQPLPAVR